MNLKPFIQHLRSMNIVESTIRAYGRDLKLLDAFLTTERISLRQVKPQTIMKFVTWMAKRNQAASNGNKLSPATIARRLASLSTFFAFVHVHSNGRIANPMISIDRPRLGRMEPPRVEESDLNKLLDGIASNRDKTLFTLLAFSGLRLSEVCKLDRDSIHVEETESASGELIVIGVGEVTGKGSKNCQFLIDQPTLDLLAEYLTTRKDELVPLFLSRHRKRISPRTVQKRLHHWCKTLGLPRIRVHALRHAFAQRLADDGIDVAVLAALMNHNDLKTTSRYFAIKKTKAIQQYFAAMQVISNRSTQSNKER